jgi:endonuclease/exonuclease/phosphatase family metal-dependent hydrolase
MVFAEAAQRADRGAARDPRRRPRAREAGVDHRRQADRSTAPAAGPTIITGDFNLEPEDPLHARMQAPFADGTPRLADTWEALNPGVAHPSTFCIYMKMEPGGSELHCDFFFVSEDLKPRLKSIRVDQQTQASDHQPVILELD